jgi:hypothetical protein
MVIVAGPKISCTSKMSVQSQFICTPKTAVSACALLHAALCGTSKALTTSSWRFLFACVQERKVVTAVWPS